MIAAGASTPLNPVRATRDRNELDATPGMYAVPLIVNFSDSDQKAKKVPGRLCMRHQGLRVWRD